MQSYFTIFINGQPFNCDSSMCLSDVLKYLNIDINKVIVEYNNYIVNKIQFDNLYFKDEDSIEVISIVGGG
uniref:Thiamin biosynthesis protein S n=1 Tax=Dipterosiphonia australica TaxID=2007208 RepID=A0A1Z1MME7_9FLOR|nr:thiamin biosynthesis protein S [Dipterosiphonia australica]ARW66921.1 thiamin biosynthesis protein S [Dipterosiphonia australica]